MARRLLVPPSSGISVLKSLQPCANTRQSPVSPEASDEDSAAPAPHKWNAHGRAPQRKMEPGSPSGSGKSMSDAEDGHVSNDGHISNDGQSLPVQKRRRVTRACDECRRKKIKCDGKQPCTHCSVYSYGRQTSSSSPEQPPQSGWRGQWHGMQLFQGTDTD